MAEPFWRTQGGLRYLYADLRGSEQAVSSEMGLGIMTEVDAEPGPVRC